MAKKAQNVVGCGVQKNLVHLCMNHKGIKRHQVTWYFSFARFALRTWRNGRKIQAKHRPPTMSVFRGKPRKQRKKWKKNDHDLSFRSLRKLWPWFQNNERYRISSSGWWKTGGGSACWRKLLVKAQSDLQETRIRLTCCWCMEWKVFVIWKGFMFWK